MPRWEVRRFFFPAKVVKIDGITAALTETVKSLSKRGATELREVNFARSHGKSSGENPYYISRKID